ATSHDPFFPIAAGSSHALGSDTPAISCNSCHGNSSSFQQFDCLSCHQHQNQTALDTTHPGMTQYADTTATSYGSHPHRTPGGAFPVGAIGDPAQDVSVDAQIPSYVDTSISSFSLRTEILAMPMDHASTNVDATALGSCGNCHVNASSGGYYPGEFHTALVTLNLQQPTPCGHCHATPTPTAFAAP